MSSANTFKFRWRLNSYLSESTDQLRADNDCDTVLISITEVHLTNIDQLGFLYESLKDDVITYPSHNTDVDLVDIC